MIDAHRAQTMRSVQEREARITTLAVERGFFTRIFNWFRIRGLKAEIATLYKADSHYSSALDQTIARVRSLLNSTELAGAEAELAVIDRLRMLPSSTVVFNDVQLQATRYIHFDGTALMSAQIDHVVLTPAGVFVIETKRWSHRFVESGDFYSPFDQVSRASYLCYDLLRESFGNTRVRSIIVCVGSLPEAPRDSYIKVVRPESLNATSHGFAMLNCRLNVSTNCATFSGVALTVGRRSNIQFNQTNFQPHPVLLSGGSRHQSDSGFQAKYAWTAAW